MMGPGGEFYKKCNCWVRKQAAEQAFGIRRGAHNGNCPEYARSQDPVDRANDLELRLMFEANGTPTVQGGESG